MFTDREILSVVEMLKNENLDVRTVTLGLNLLDCASDDIGRFTHNIYTRITKAAENLVQVCDDVGDKYGIPVVNKRISVSPIAVAGAPFAAEQMLEVANTLNAAATAAFASFPLARTLICAPLPAAISMSPMMLPSGLRPQRTACTHMAPTASKKHPHPHPPAHITHKAPTNPCKLTVHPSG